VQKQVSELSCAAKLEKFTVFVWHTRSP